MPFWDDYDAVLGFLNNFLVSENINNKLQLLFSQHNEHRIVFNRIIELVQYYLSGNVNFYFLTIFGNIAWILSFFVVFKLFYNNIKEIKYFLPVSIIFFSLLTHELIPWAMGSIQQYYQVLFMLLAYYFISEKISKKNFFFSQFFLFIGVWTGGAGIVFYIPAIIYFAFSKRFKELIISILLFIFNFYLYFIFLNFHFISQNGTLGFALSHLYKLFFYVLQFIGNFNITKYAFIDGFILAIVSIYIFFKKPSVIHFLIFLSVLLVAAVTGISRLHFGIFQALSSRYTIYSILLFSITYLSLLDYNNKKQNKKIFRIALILSIVMLLFSYPNGVRNLLKFDYQLDTRCIVYPNFNKADSIIKRSEQLGIYYLNCEKK